MLPSAHLTLYFLAAFLGLWGASLVLRGIRGRRRADRRCPSCRLAMTAANGLDCPGCGYRASDARELCARRRSWPMIAAGVSAVGIGVMCGITGDYVWRWSHLARSPGRPPVGPFDAAAAAVLLFGAIVLARGIAGDRSRGRRRCPKCWYDMAGSGLRCPECGHDAGEPKRLYAARRSRVTIAMGMFMLAAAVAVQGIPRVQRGGWRATIPTTVLIAGLPWLPVSVLDNDTSGAQENWTLAGRMLREEPWGWQRRWLNARSRALVAPGSDVSRLRRALSFVDEGDADLADRAVLLIARGLTDENAEVRALAALCCSSPLLAGHDPGGPELERELAPLMPGLVRVMTDDQESLDVVIAAMMAAGFSGRSGEEAVPHLLGMMKVSAQGNAAWSMRRGQYAALVLAHLAPSIPSIRPMLLRGLEERGPARAVCYARALADHRVFDAEAERALLAIVATADDGDAQAAAWALAASPARPEVVIPALLAQLDSARQSRGRFLNGMTYRYEKEFMPHLPRIIAALHDPSDDVRIAAVELLDSLTSVEGFELDRSAAWPILQGLRKDPVAGVAAAADRVIQWAETRRQYHAPAPAGEPP